MPTSILLRADQVIEEACLLQRMSLFLARTAGLVVSGVPTTRLVVSLLRVIAPDASVM